MMYIPPTDRDTLKEALSGIESVGRSEHLDLLSRYDGKVMPTQQNIHPTTQKVIKLLKFPETMTMEEMEVSNHLRLFVRELDEENLKYFLRFSTGSDLDVAFVVQSDFARRPVAHTCSCLLEL